MYKNIWIGFSLILLIAGIFLPSWYIALPGLLLLSAPSPVFGVVFGFILDILFGASPFLPDPLNFPFMFGALAVGLLSLFLRKYIRS